MRDGEGMKVTPMDGVNWEKSHPEVGPECRAKARPTPDPPPSLWVGLQPDSSIHPQRAQEARREAQRACLAVAVAGRRSQARRAVAVAIARPEVHARSPLLRA